MNSRSKKKILILGGSGFIGRRLFRKLGPGRAVATYHKNAVCGQVYFDALSMRLADIIKEPREISHALILLGDTDPESCAADANRSQTLNVHSIKSILQDLLRLRIKPVFFSSEFVFDGKKGRYVETDVANPILLYGRQKLAVEDFIRDNFPDHIIIRLAKTFGAEPGDGTLFSNWLAHINENTRQVRCAGDQIFSLVYIEDVLEATLALIDKDCRGLYHLGGSKAYSRIELLRMLLGCLKEHISLQAQVVACSINDFDLREKRPLDVSMLPDKLLADCGIKLSDVGQVCKNMVEAKFGNHAKKR